MTLHIDNTNRRDSESTPTGMNNPNVVREYVPSTVKEVQQTIGRLHDYTRDHEQDYHQIKAVKEITKVLFVKIAEEERQKQGGNNRFKAEQLTGCSDATLWINNLFTDHLKEAKLGFDEQEIKLSSKTTEKFVSELDSLNFSEADIDIKGVAYEKILENIFRDDLGQFFTPRSVVKFMVGMLDPVYDIEGNNTDRVIDPAVGSGGFLTEVLNHYSRQKGSTVDFETASETIYGIDKTSWLLPICNTNLHMHTRGPWTGFGNVYQGNSLHTQNEEIPVERPSGERSSVPLNYFDKLIANPPFGSEEDQELANNFFDESETVHKEVEALFIKRALELVRPGGDIAIVVPKTIVKGPKFEGLREWIWDNAIIKASIHLPLVTFRPFKAEMQTAILHLTKRDGSLEQGPIYFDAATYVGHDGQGNTIPKNDLPSILESYLKWCEQ